MYFFSFTHNYSIQAFRSENHFFSPPPILTLMMMMMMMMIFFWGGGGLFLLPFNEYFGWVYVCMCEPIILISFVQYFHIETRAHNPFMQSFFSSIIYHKNVIWNILSSPFNEKHIKLQKDEAKNIFMFIKGPFTCKICRFSLVDYVCICVKIFYISLCNDCIWFGSIDSLFLQKTHYQFYQTKYILFLLSSLYFRLSHLYIKEIAKA